MVEHWLHSLCASNWPTAIAVLDKQSENSIQVSLCCQSMAISTAPQGSARTQGCVDRQEMQGRLPSPDPEWEHALLLSSTRLIDKRGNVLYPHAC